MIDEEFKQVVYKLIIASVAIVVSGTGCSYLNKKAGMEDDHPLEEHFENFIEQQTGLDIDLSPESSE